MPPGCGRLNPNRERRQLIRTENRLIVIFEKSGVGLEALGQSNFGIVELF